MAVVEVEEALDEFEGWHVAALFHAGEELGAVVDQRGDDAADQFVAGGEVVVERGFGDAEAVGDLLQAGLLHAFGGEQLARGLHDPLLGVGRSGHGPNLT